MKIELIESLDDLTLGKYLEFMELNKDSETYEQEVFSHFTGVPINQVKNVSKKDFDEVAKQIADALQREGQFKHIFTIDNIEFGIIPNFDKILGNENVKGSEYSDMILYSKFDENGYNSSLDRLIAVLYRPIKNKDRYNSYLIEEYNGTEGHIEQIRKLPMSIVNGCLSFFLILSEQLEMHIQAYTVAEQLKAS